MLVSVARTVLSVSVIGDTVILPRPSKELLGAGAFGFGSINCGMLKRPCRTYNATGKCHFGEHCKFLHSTINITQEEKCQILQQNEAVSKVKVTTSEQLPLENQNFDEKSREENHGSLKPEKQEASGSEKEKGNICRSYANTRFCRYGSRCRFKHILPSKPTQKLTGIAQTDKAPSIKEENVKAGLHDGSKTNQVQDENGEKTPSAQDAKKLSKDSARAPTSRKVCKFFRRGFCHYGKSCYFYHPADNNTSKSCEKEEPVDTTECTEITDAEKWTKVARTPKVINIFKRDEVDDAKLKELRTTEITQLKRRFPAENLKLLEETDKKASFVFTFIPTDPDWPFDVRSFDIQVSFNENYPLKLFSVDVPLDQDLPATVQRYIKASLEEWTVKKEEECQKKGIVELLFRPFLRWMDRNMENIVTEGLKQLRRDLNAREAGLQFITANELRKEQDCQVPDDEASTVDSAVIDTEKDSRRPVVYRKFDNTEEEVYTGPDPEANIGTLEDSSSEDDDEDDNSNGDSEETGNEKGHQRPQIDPNTERRGTEMSFRNKWVWYLTTILVEKLRLVVQCERCKNTTDFITPPNRVNSIACSKCNNTQLVVYRPVLSHANCTTFGYLDLEGCTAFDVILQDCHFSLGCVMCGRDFLSKSYVLGRVMEVRCRGCHSVMKFAADAVKLTPLTFDGVDSSKFSGKVYTVGSRKNRRVPKDPAIQEGKPLPENGACKHYKKSFRWLRFPCCGKAYPCDICHDDKEDHPMVFANRMICGYCCKEQAYAAERPCKGCGGALTKVHTTHWEGGKGCRNKVTMSRNDEKKYSNLEKTVSKSLQEKKTGKKKNTNPGVKITSNWT